MLYMFLADGFEEIEAIATLDVLRRADIEVATVGVTDKVVTGTHNIKVVADKTIDEITTENLIGIILPGGMPGTENLENSQIVKQYIAHCFHEEKLICAICAAPSILGHMGILDSKLATCYPGFEKELKKAFVSKELIAIDDNIITAKGAGAAIKFALNIVANLKSRKLALSIKESMQCPK